MLMAWSHTTSESLHPGSFPTHDTQVVSRYPARHNLREPDTQTTTMSCPAYSPSTYQMPPAHDSTVVSCPTTEIQEYSAAHDLMSCPKLHNTNPSSTQQSVRIQKPIPATVKKYPEIPFSQIFYPKTTQELLLYLLIPENRTQSPKYARKT